VTSGPELGPEASAEVVRLLVAAGIDASYLAFVRTHVHAPDDGWRWCCGSRCDPCVAALGRVVDATRRLLAEPPGLPGSSGPA
jgi:hypothetical protein